MTNQQLTECMEKLEILTDKIIELTDKAKEQNNSIMPNDCKQARQKAADNLVRLKLAIEKRMS